MYLQGSRFSARHAFSTREGGVSHAPFDSLNLGGSVGDEPDRVARNLERFADAFGMRSVQLATVRQVHGDRVLVCDQRPETTDALADADALITRTPGIAVAVRTADCVPVLLHAPDVKAVGAAHAGWRGAIAAIAAQTARALVREYGADLAKMEAIIGPSIGPCCYEVDAALYERFRERFGEEALARRGGRLHLDLASASRIALLEIGLSEERIEQLPNCTACDERRFFSHRRDQGKTGRHLSFVCLG